MVINKKNPNKIKLLECVSEFRQENINCDKRKEKARKRKKKCKFLLKMF